MVERYGLTDIEVPNHADIDVWKDDWAGEPREIAVGWVTFAERWDWDNPVIAYEAFEVPSDFYELFGYDGLHPEGEPDLSLYYEGTFSKLCVTIDDAEALSPMTNFGPISFGSETNAPTRKIGRPKRSGYESADEALVREMMAEWKKDKTLKPRNLAEKYVNQAVGHGTRDSKIKRLERRLRFMGI